MTFPCPAARHCAPTPRMLAGPARLFSLVASVLLFAGCTPPQPTVDPSPPPDPAPTTLTPPTVDTDSLLSPDVTADDAPPSPIAGEGQPASPLAALALTWLDGIPDDPAMLIDGDDGQLWQGKVSGEYAWIDDHGYRWLGADGAMVACRTDAGCVGIDSHGLIVTQKSDSEPRDVYTAGGEFIGRFTPEGVEQPAPGNTLLPVAEAMTATGVDMADVLAAATTRPDFAGAVTGDPHLITAGGFRYSAQVTGQFVARDGDRGIQLQFSPMDHHPQVAVVDEVALQVDGVVLTIDAQATVVIDGQPRIRPAAFSQHTLPSGAVVGRWPADDDRSAAVVVRWPDGSTVSVTANPALGLTVVAHGGGTSPVQGLFGPTDTEAGESLTSRYHSRRDVLGAVNSWRVTESERLFPQGLPTPTRSVPLTVDIPAAAQRVAEIACQDAGIVPPVDIAACAFDVGVTGDTGFIAGHQHITAAAQPSELPVIFTDLSPALALSAAQQEMAQPLDISASQPHEVVLPARGWHTWRVSLEEPQAMQLIFSQGCSAEGAKPGWRSGAVRFFDLSGLAVTPRLSLCGQPVTETLPAGEYVMLLAAASSSVDIRLEIMTTP